MSTPRIWQHTLSGDDPVVAQHHVQGANLLPGAAMIGLLLEAARALDGAIPVGLATARISAPLAVAAGETVTIEVQLHDDPEGARVSLFSARADGQRVRHLTGRLLTTRSTAPTRLPLPEGEGLPAPNLYGAYLRRQMRYGPAFQCVEWYFPLGPEECSARLVRPDAAPAVSWPLDPFLLDAALHAALPLMASDGAPVVPYRFEALELLAPLPARGWVHVRTLPASDEHQPLLYQITDDQGELCLVFRMIGVHLQPTPGSGEALLRATLDAAIGARLRAVLPGVEGRVSPEHSRQYALLKTLARDLPQAPAGPLDLEILAAADPRHAAASRILSRTLDALPELLTGRADPLAVLFPGGDISDAEGLYRDAPSSARVADALARLLPALLPPPPAPLRVLELGAGTGGTTAALLPLLKPWKPGLRYVYSDLGEMFLRHGRARFADEGLAFQRLDIETPLAGQGVEEGTFDLVIAAHVLHATRDLRDTLIRARRLLRSGGTLLLLEGTDPTYAAVNVIFGMTEGWWRLDGSDGRALPLLEPEAWLRLLAASGFRDAGAWPETPCESAILAAEADPDWEAPPERALARPSAPAASPAMPEGDLGRRLRAVLRTRLAGALRLPPEEIREDVPFAEMGLDSIMAQGLMAWLSEAIGAPCSARQLFAHPSLRALAAWLAAEHGEALGRALGEAPIPAPIPSSDQRAPIAIIGFSGRLPGAPDAETFWRLLVSGGDAVVPVPPERLVGAGPDKNWEAGLLEHPDVFDADLLGVSRREARHLDPQQRLFLELALHALEHGGYGGPRPQAVGVYVGASSGDYAERVREAGPPGPYLVTGLLHAMIANRASYLFDLGGPSVAVDTACSSALVALHAAVRALQAGDCELALAGGVNILGSAHTFEGLAAAGALSPSGRCRTFSTAADGYARGEGGGALLLKPLDRALADRDAIYGVVRAIAVNQDGRSNGPTAPNPAAQERVIRAALAQAGVSADSVTYAECHGTGTRLGDPIELESLAVAQARTRPCVIGAVKANLGHLEAAAGVASVLKVLAMFAHRVLPPSVHSHPLNPLIPWKDLPFEVLTQARPWVSEGPRRASVSSFGIGGTNAHAILEEPPPRSPPAPWGGGPLVLAISAQTIVALDLLRGQWQALAREISAEDLPDLCFTAAVGREARRFRAVLIAEGPGALKEALLRPTPAWELGEVVSEPDAARDASASTQARAWLSGAEVDWASLFGPGRRRCAAPLTPLRGEVQRLGLRHGEGDRVATSPPHPPLSGHLLPPGEGGKSGIPLLPEGEGGLRAPARPDEGEGRSTGQNPHDKVAAHPPNHFTLQRTGPLPIGEHRVGGQPMVPGAAWIDALLRAAGEAPLAVRGVSLSRPLILAEAEATVSVRRESGLALVHRDQVHAHADGIEPAGPRPLPVDLVAARAGLSPVDPVEFWRAARAAGVEHGPPFRDLRRLWLGSDRALAELEGSSVTPFLLMPTLLDGALQAATALIAAQAGEATWLPMAVARVAVWERLPERLFAEIRARNPSDAAVASADLVLCDAEGRVLARLDGAAMRRVAPPPREDLIWEPIPLPAPLGAPVATRDGRWLALTEDGNLVGRLAEALNAPVRCASLADLPALLAQGGWSGLLHLDMLAPAAPLPADEAALQAGLSAGPYALLALLKILVAVPEPPPLIVFARDPHRDPCRAAALSLLKVARREHPALCARAVSLHDGPTAPLPLWRLIAAETLQGEGAEIVWRGLQRSVWGLRPIPQPARLDDLPIPLGEGALLVVGGLTGVGLETCRMLAAILKRPLVIAQRTSPEQRAEAQAELRALGVELLVGQADVADPTAMARLIEEARARFGRIAGVLHSAGVLQDRQIRQLSPADLERVFRPKVMGTVVLDQLTRADRPELFVLYGSVSSLFGNVGQAAHVAANAFEDAFIHARREATGLPGLALTWGVWGETGSVAHPRYLAAMRAAGLEPMQSAEALLGLRRVLARPDGHRLVVKGDQRASPWPVTREAPAAELSLALDRVEALLPIEGVGEALERAARLVAGAALLPWFSTRLKNPVGLEEFADQEGIAAPQLPRLAAALRALRDTGLAVEEGGRWSIPPGAAAPTPARALDEAIAALPDGAQPLTLLAGVAAAYPDVLTGRVPPLQPLFPGGDTRALSALYRSPLLFGPAYQLARAAVEGAVDRLRGAGRVPRVLEIGAGTGALSEILIPALAGRLQEYVYTDVSAAFLRLGRRLFEAEGVRFQRFDLREDPEAQGLEPGSFDLVVAANVMHTADALRPALDRAQRLLAPDGHLVLVEVTRPGTFGDLVFGLTEEWWSFADRDLRPESPCLPARAWGGLLREQGFAAWRVAPPTDEGQSVIVAERGVRQRENSLLTNSLPHPPLKGHLLPPGEGEEKITFPFSPREKVPPKGADEGDPRDRVERWLLAQLAAVLERPAETLSRTAGFLDLGVDSLLAMELASRIGEAVGDAVPPTLLFDHPSLPELAAALTGHYGAAWAGGAAPKPAPEAPAPEATPAAIQPATGSVAIIGLSLRFPGADDVPAFWRLLIEGRDAMVPVPESRWAVKRHHRPWLDTPYAIPSPLGGFLGEVGGFDPLLFRMTPVEALSVDPQQRLALELCWEALEDAGIAGPGLRSLRGGVFFGGASGGYGERFSLNAYLERGLSPDPGLPLGLTPAMISNRVSWFLGWRGPSFTVDTACSASLAALHLALRSLRAGECELALCGGVHLHLTPSKASLEALLGALSPEGRSAAFDQDADGFALGEGAGVLVLKPLERALADNDTIYAVIRGSAMNHNGGGSGITAPSPAAQTELIGSALKDAGVGPGSLSYLEAHGTGTRLGDPLELQAAARALGTGRGTIGVGSVKSNLGHLEGAAGMAGLIKTALMLRMRTLVPTLHLRRPNPLIPWVDGPFYAVDRVKSWEGPEPLRAGVSSFGMGGANGFAVLEEPPRSRPTSPSTDPCLLLISARTSAALDRRILGLARLLSGRDALPFGIAAAVADLARSLAGRERLPARAAVVVPAGAGLREALEGAAHRGLAPVSRVARAALAPPDAVSEAALEQLKRWAPVRTLEIALKPAFTPEERVEATARLIEALFARAGLRPTAEPELTVRLHLEPDAREGALHAAAELLAAGVELDLSIFNPPGQKIWLPPYPFERLPLMAEPVLPLPSAAPRAPDAAPNPLLWTLGEVERPLGPPIPIRAEAWLLLTDELGVLDRVADRLAAQGQRVVCARPGPRDRRTGPDRFTFASARGLAELRRELPPGLTVLDGRGLHFADEAPEAASSVLDLSELQRALGPQDTLCILVAGGLPGSGSPSPSAAARVAAARVAARERPALRCRVLELELGADAPAALAERVLAELAQAPGTEAPPALDRAIAWRGGRRVGLSLVPAGAARGPSPIPRGAVCVVTGGRSGVGRALADAIRERFGAQVACLSRRAPVGSSPHLELVADVRDAGSLAPALEDVRAKLGPIQVLIHAAGVLESGPLDPLGAPALAAVLDPKVQGTLHLEALCAADPLVAFVQCSSLAALLAGPNLGAHAAACAWQMGWAEARRARGLPGTALILGQWAETGSATDPRLRALLAGLGFGAMGTAEAVDACLDALRLDAPLVAMTRLSARAPAEPKRPTRTSPTSEQSQAVAMLEDAARAAAAWALRSTLPDQVRPRFQRLWRALLRHGEGQTADWSLLLDAAERRFPALAPMVALIRRAVTALPEVLVGRKDPGSVLFAGGDLAALANVYAATPTLGLASEAIAAALSARVPAGGRVLEVGGGTGAASRVVFPRLVERAECWFTDVGGLFLDAAARWLDPRVRRARYDIERPAEEQGLVPASFDAVFAANVVHTTADLRATLRRLLALLRPGGTLALAESCQPMAWLDLTVGLTDGWWAFQDAPMRTEGPLVSAEVWIQIARGLDAEASVQTVGEGDMALILLRAPVGAAPREDLLPRLRALAADAMGLRPEDLDPDLALRELGVDSVRGVELCATLGRALGRELSPDLLFLHPTLRELAAELERRSPVAPPPPVIAPSSASIALVGTAVRLPGAPDLDALWRLLLDGGVSVGPVPADRWDNDAVFDPEPGAPGKVYTRRGGFLDEVQRFDPAFFRVSPKDARLMDPQQRLLLEVCHAALEDAAMAGAALDREEVGVFVGASAGEYGNLARQLGISDPALGAGLSPAVLANRISYALDLHGPSLTVDTACSSSLVALDQAAEALRRGDCSLAIVAGVNLMLDPERTSLLCQARVLSPGDRCAPFSEGADGYLRGEGCAALVLKPLDRAIADGDPIRAVLLGSALNQDGRTNGISAPNPEAQTAVIRRAWQRAGLAPARMGLLHSHGTGTPLGDPVEAHAAAIAVEGAPVGGVALAALKANIGHLEPGAGAAAVVAAALSVERGQIPPLASFIRPNPRIVLERSPLRVPLRAEPWRGERLAGVSAFGLGGTNAHAVLGEAPARVAVVGKPPYLFLLSARRPEALREAATEALALLASADPGSVCRSLAQGRRRWPYRLALVAQSAGALTEAVRAVASGSSVPDPAPGSPDLSMALSLAQAWRAGETPDLRAWHRDHGGPALHLPPAPQERVRCWLERGASTWTMAWVERAAQDSGRPEGRWALLGEDRARIGRVAGALRGAGIEVDTPGEERAIAGGYCGILWTDGCSWKEEKLTTPPPHPPPAGLEDGAPSPSGRRGGRSSPPLLPEGEGAPRGADEGAGRPPGQDLGPLFHFAGDLARAARTGTSIPPQLVVWSTHPGRTTEAIRSLCAALPHEIAGLSVRHIDAPEELLRQSASLGLLAEGSGSVRWRDGRLLAPTFVPWTSIDRGAAPESALITGGASGVGLVLALSLAKAGTRRLALLGRSPEARRAEAIVALRQAGAEVLYLSTDLGQERSVREALRTVHERLGPLRLVVHAAGLTEDSAYSLAGKSPDAWRVCWDPKARGAELLERCWEGPAPDRWLAMGSLAACSGAMAAGLADYAAANGFLEGLAARGPWRVVHWGLWDGVGMGARSAGRTARMAALGLEPLAPEQAIEVFWLMLAPDAPRSVLAVGARPGVDPMRWLDSPAPRLYRRELDRSTGLLPHPAWPGRPGPLLPPGEGEHLKPPLLPEGEGGRRPDEGEAWSIHRNPVEPAQGADHVLRRLQANMAALLQLSPSAIDPDLPFADFGVDSLVLADLVARIERELGRALNPSVLIEQGTPRRVAAWLAAQAPAPEAAPEDPMAALAALGALE